MSYRGVTARNRRWAGVSAIAAFVVFTAANSLWAFEQPAPGASASELISFYEEGSGRIVAGGLLSLVSLAILVVAASALRSVLVELEPDELLANAAFGGAILGAAAGLGAETINMAGALRAGDGELTAPLALALFDISYVLGSYGAGIGIGLLTLATALAALRTGTLLPRWMAVAGVVIGTAMITPLFGYALGEYTVAPAFVLLLVLGVLLLRRSAVRAGPEHG